MALLSDCVCESHPAGAVFYVTAINDAGQVARLSGPHDPHPSGEGLMDVEYWTVLWPRLHTPLIPVRHRPRFVRDVIATGGIIPERHAGPAGQPS